MKTQIFKIGVAGLAAAIFPFVNGCVAQSSEAQKDSTNAPALAVVQPAPFVNAAPATEPPPLPAELAAKPEAVPAGQKSLPANLILKADSPSAEIIKLAQAGVDDSVMLAYITNSTRTFGLGPDEIIYLNDLGVSGGVVTTMLEHDRAMKQIWANAAPAQTTSAPAAVAPTVADPADEIASAPSYVAPPTTAVEPQPAVVNNNYFYDTLSPYGSWIEIEGYGRCWQPTVVVGNRNWQPYGDRGRWVYSDAGWYWLSDYSWGATTFHYGRWFNHSRWGWCWWPDTVWGPSWVTWRYSNDYCGWAPLPPHSYYRPGFGFSYRGSSVGFGFDFGISASWFTFVPTSRFCDPRPYHHRVSRHNVTTVYNNTTVINNYGSGNNNTVINRGIDPDRIRPVSRTEIRQVALRDAPPSVGKGSRGERLERDGRTLLVNRPQLPASREELRRETAGNPAKPLAGEPARPPGAKGAAELRTTPNARVGEARGERNNGQPRNRLGEEKTAASPATPAPAKINSSVVTAQPRPTEPRPAPTAEVQSPATQRESQIGRTRGPESVQRSRERVENRNPAISPVTVTGSGQPTQPSAPSRAPEKVSPPTPAPVQGNAPAGSPIVIGRRDGGQPQGRSPSATYPPPTRVTPEARPSARQPQVSVPQATVAAPPKPVAPSTTHNWPANSPRQENRSTPRSTYAAPAPVQRSIAPAAPTPSPAPRFSAPSPAPSVNRAPSYTPSPAPAPSYARPQPAPSVSAPRAPSFSPPASSPSPVSRPQPSAPSRSDSESRSRGRN